MSVAGLGIGSLVVIYLAFRWRAGPYYDWYMLVAANIFPDVPAAFGMRPRRPGARGALPGRLEHVQWIQWRRVSVEPSGGSILTFRMAS